MGIFNEVIYVTPSIGQPNSGEVFILEKWGTFTVLLEKTDGTIIEESRNGFFLRYTLLKTKDQNPRAHTSEGN